MTTIEFTQLEKARMNLENIESRIVEINTRLALIPGLLADQSKRLGAAIIGKLSAGAIHSQMDKLEHEARELRAEADALAPIRAEAEAALHLAQAEAARERYSEIAAQAVELPLEIFTSLEAAYQGLKKFEEMQDQLRECDQIAGRLAPITVKPSSAIFIPLGISDYIRAARFSIAQVNVQALTAQGFNLED